MTRMADEDTERTGKPVIALTLMGDAMVSLVHVEPGADLEAGTDDDIPANFVLGPGLGDFPHEKYITGRDGEGENTGTRVILFTDIKQANAPSDEITASVVSVNVSATRIVDLGMAMG